jgi:hypothetical protein
MGAFFMANIYRTQEEIIRLGIDSGIGANASVSTSRLSDLRVAQLGTARRSEIIAYINSLSGGSETRWHDAWEEYLRSKSINDSKYVEEERGVFHKTSSYP